MALLKVVLDTNAILRSISGRSPFSIILDKLDERAYELHVTNDILPEYEEKIAGIFSMETAELAMGRYPFFQTPGNQQFITTFILLI